MINIFRIQGLGVRVKGCTAQGLILTFVASYFLVGRFWASDLGICLGLMVQGLRFRVQGLGFRVQGSGFRVHGLGFRV
jgi:hypothetical protein